jgi:methyl acetate hydrolase
MDQEETQMQNLPQIDEALRRAAELKEVPGIVAIAATGHEIIYQGAFGRRDIGKDDAMTPDSVFWIASMTKAITCAAAMQLVEQGKLSLDEPIAGILPQLAAPKVLEGFDEKGVPRLRDAKRPITLKLLMTHMAGFCYDIWNADMGRYMEQAGIPGIITCAEAALTTPLAHEPGEKWEYGINIDFVGKAIEAVSGKKLDAYLKDHIFAPLGMTDTAFKLGSDQRRRLVGMHTRGADGSLSPMPFELTQEPEFHMGGGGLYGTAPDYIRFLQAMLNGGERDGNRILKAETVKLMGQNHIGEHQVTKLPTAMPPYSNDVDLYPDQVKKWGLSFLINTQRTAEGRSPSSLAWAGLANTYFWLDPALGVAGVILMQLIPFADRKALELFGVFERGVYAGLRPSRAAA